MVDSDRIQNPWMSEEQSIEPNLGEIVIVDQVSTTMPELTGLKNGDGSGASTSEIHRKISPFDVKLGIGESAFSAAGAAFLSAIIVNPLDVVKERAFSTAGTAFLSAAILNPLDVGKTRLQAQAAGVPYSHPLSNAISRMSYFGPNMMFADLRCSPSCARAGVHGTVSICPPDCFQYKGTLDVFNKIIRQEGFSRLWRGTNAGLAVAIPMVGIYLPCYDIFRNKLEELAAINAPSLVPYAPSVAGALARSLACATCCPIELARTRMQAFKETQISKKPPGVWKTLLEVLSSVKKTNSGQNSLQGYRILWTGMGAQLARDVPYSAICWSTLEPIRRKLLGLVGDEASVAAVLGANFSAGFVAGSIAAAATCPLDVAKTRRQIEKDPIRAVRMTTWQTLAEVWRSGRMKGLFTGVGPRVCRAGPSVGIVVSFYEGVKYVLHHHHLQSASS